MKWTVWWRDPDRPGNPWTVYQSGLTEKRAAKLARDVHLVLSPRWVGRNVSTKALPAGYHPTETS